MASKMYTSIPLFISVLVLVLAAVGSTIATIASVDEVNHWHKTFPTVDMPTLLATHLSPLTTSDVDRYAKQILDGSLVAANSQAFCKAAGLVCGEDVFVDAAPGGHQSYNINSEVLDPEQFEKLAQDPDRIDFFREKQLLKGGTLRLPNLQVPQQPHRKLLPRLLAQKFLLTHDTLPILLRTLDIPDRSNLSLQVHTTMSRCLAPAMRGEAKKCVSSLEDMTDFIASTIGPDFIVLPAQDATGRQTAKLLDVAQLTASTTALTCHENMYPFQVYFCHFISNTKIYQLKLQLQDGSVITKVTTCHMDTSQWPERHPAFAVLHTLPGHSEACHYIIQNDLLLIPAPKLH